ncbi:ankyrin repeat domain-containing protein, chloroplastic [Canna indica]|uniref:Ankyrin repeat domain-containing protein, chloroplastic n=1 Tax=Canna indica TaxID=4628 RepID=A0AAQ3K2B0_9LILI|nr:ankyrin repeat domain-containing protein, chloroplastic [Canna indica]
MPPPCSLLLSLDVFIPLAAATPRYLPFSRSPPFIFPLPSPSSTAKPFPLTAAAASSSPSSTPTSFPYSYPNHYGDHEQESRVAAPQDDELVIGDCLVFEDGAFEDGDPFEAPAPSPSAVPKRSSRRKPAATVVEPESLVPEKWKETVEEINLTKKEKRKISHELKFGSRMERKKKTSVPDMEEYRARRETMLSRLKPVALDDPRGFPKEEAVVEPPGPEGSSGGRVAPRNPRLGLDGGKLEDIADFFNSGKYVPRDAYDDKNPKGRRKLFTEEEKKLLNRRIPNLAEAISNKWLPLHSLAASGEFFLVDTLLKHNVDINGVDKDGLSAMHKAILCKKQAVINYLLRNSANPFIRDNDGATLIHYAVQTASSQTIKILLLYNVDINLADNDGWTPLHVAVQTQRTDIVRLLLIKGADKTLKNGDGLTPLDLCLYSGRSLRTYELIKLLKQHRSRSTP